MHAVRDEHSLREVRAMSAVLWAHACHAVHAARRMRGLQTVRGMRCMICARVWQYERV